MGAYTEVIETSLLSEQESWEVHGVVGVCAINLDPSFLPVIRCIRASRLKRFETTTGTVQYINIFSCAVYLNHYSQNRNLSKSSNTLEVRLLFNATIAFAV